MVNVVSHELRTPLSSVVGFAELLLIRKFTEEQREQFLQTILAEGERLTTLINDFLDLQRMQMGAQTLPKEPVDLEGIVKQAIAVAGPDEAHPIAVELGSSAVIYAAPDQILQVVLNLISNARKYSPAGGEVRLAVHRTPDAVEVAVTDQGLGLPPEAHARLFDKFYRVEGPDRRGIKGTGLGLSICREIVEAHGGRIWASSAGVGQGSTFTFTLPILD